MSATRTTSETGDGQGNGEYRNSQGGTDGTQGTRGTCVACRSAKVKCKPVATADGVQTVLPESTTPLEGGDGKLDANETLPKTGTPWVACQRCQRLSLVCVQTPPSRRGRPGERRGKRRRVDPTTTALDSLPAAVEEEVLAAATAAGLTRVPSTTPGETGKTDGIGR